MRIYTYSEARKKLAIVLREARQEGEVRIRRRSGEEFSLRPVERAGSPLDVGEPVKTKVRITHEDILRAGGKAANAATETLSESPARRRLPV